jgi:hypothetical protein
MFCPFCLAEVTFSQEKGYICPTCKEQIPALYVQDYQKYPPVVVSAVGFREHGKTVYFASLFYVLKKSSLPQHWSGFYRSEFKRGNPYYSTWKLSNAEEG